MGRIATDEMLATGNDMEVVLRWHLTANHYPPLPVALIGPCMDAIDMALADEWDEMVPLPEGLSYRGVAEAPVREIVDLCHLDGFLAQHDD